jgi:hypothetical protein
MVLVKLCVDLLMTIQVVSMYVQMYMMNICMFVRLFAWWCFNATFNNISDISWRSILLMEETGGPGQHHRPVASHWQPLSHNVVHLALVEIRTHTMSGYRQFSLCDLSKTVPYLEMCKPEKLIIYLSFISGRRN